MAGNSPDWPMAAEIANYRGSLAVGGDADVKHKGKETRLDGLYKSIVWDMDTHTHNNERERRLQLTKGCVHLPVPAQAAQNAHHFGDLA